MLRGSSSSIRELSPFSMSSSSSSGSCRWDRGQNPVKWHGIGTSANIRTSTWVPSQIIKGSFDYQTHTVYSARETEATIHNLMENYQTTITATLETHDLVYPVWSIPLKTSFFFKALQSIFVRNATLHFSYPDKIAICSQSGALAQRKHKNVNIFTREFMNNIALCAKRTSCICLRPLPHNY